MKTSPPTSPIKGGEGEVEDSLGLSFILISLYSHLTCSALSLSTHTSHVRLIANVTATMTANVWYVYVCCDNDEEDMKMPSKRKRSMRGRGRMVAEVTLMRRTAMKVGTRTGSHAYHSSA